MFTNVRVFSFPNINILCLDCVVHGQSNKSNIKVSALQASVGEGGINSSSAICTYIPSVCMYKNGFHSLSFER